MVCLDLLNYCHEVISNIKESSQYIDEIEPDSPVPFNVPIESNGLLSFGVT